MGKLARCAFLRSVLSRMKRNGKDFSAMLPAL